MDSLIDTIERYTAAYERGVLTPHEFALHLFDLFIESETNDDEVAQAFSLVPDAIIPALRSELQKFADADYYRRTFGIGDTRTEDQIHADALARQPKLRHTCKLIRPLVLSRDRTQNAK